METTPPVGANPPLPPGVTENTPVPAATHETPPAAAAPASTDVPGGEKWNALEIVAGIGLVLAGCFAVWYFRFKSTQLNDKEVENGKKISNLTTIVNKLQKENQQQYQ